MRISKSAYIMRWVLILIGLGAMVGYIYLAGKYVFHWW